MNKKKKLKHGALGGLKTLKKHGRSHFAKLAKKRWKKWKELQVNK